MRANENDIDMDEEKILKLAKQVDWAMTSLEALKLHLECIADELEEYRQVREYRDEVKTKTEALHRGETWEN